MSSELKGCGVMGDKSMSLAAVALASNNHLNCSLSAINHLDYDSLLMQTNTNTSSQKTITTYKGMHLFLQPYNNKNTNKNDAHKAVKCTLQ